MTQIDWDIHNNEKISGFAKVVGTDDNAYELMVQFTPADYRDQYRDGAKALNGWYMISRAKDNRKNSMASEELYRSPEFPADSITDVIARCEETFMRFEKPVRNLTDQEWFVWNDIVDPHDVKNMSSDYMIMGRKRGSKGKFEAYNNWNGKFGSMRWGMRIKPKEKEHIEKQLYKLEEVYPDYEIEMRQGSGTYFDLNRKRRGRR